MTISNYSVLTPSYTACDLLYCPKLVHVYLKQKEVLKDIFLLWTLTTTPLLLSHPSFRTSSRSFLPETIHFSNKEEDIIRPTSSSTRVHPNVCHIVQ